MVVPRHSNRETQRGLVMHGMIGNADHSSMDTGDDCVHYRQIIASRVALVEEDIHPSDPIGAGRIGFDLVNGNPISIKHLIY